MHRVLIADGDISSCHCRMHGKDFSDCIVYHFSRQYKCDSRSNPLRAILREALQGRWGTLVERSPNEASRDAPEIHDEDESGLERHNERAGTEAGVLSTPSLPLQTQSDTKYAREPEFISGFRYNGEILNDSVSEAVTAHGAEVRAVECPPKSVCDDPGMKAEQGVLFANNAGSSTVAAKSCGYPVADDRESEISTRTSRVTSHHGDRNFSRTEQKKRKWEFIGDGTDPLEVLGVDLMLMVFWNLDALSLARCGAVSKGWLPLAGRDDLWQRQCDSLWESKAHLPSSAFRKGLTKKEAYSITVIESKRTKITRKDLCDHVWEFRFKKVAPDYWLSLDPSWHGMAPMQRYFHEDGSQTAGPNDAVWGGHECRYYLIDIPPSEEKSVRYVRINHWPILTVSRTQNWGWELNNEIYVYNSVADKKKLGTVNEPVNGIVTESSQ